MMGFGRAVGETMIVLMATGNSPVRALRNRKEDNTKLGRVQGSEHDSSRAPAREKLEEVVEREEVLA